MLRQKIVEQKKDRDLLIRQVYQSRKILENMKHMKDVANSNNNKYYSNF